MTDTEGGVTALNANQRVLQCFWDLATVEEDSRCQAAGKLVIDVLEDQAANAPAAIGEDMSLTAMQALPKPKQLEQALRKCSPLMVYALRRLARGLGSGRAASRQGFSTALASLLAGSVDGGQKLVGVPELMVLLEGSLEATGSGKGGDARDALMGRVFGLAAAVRGGLVRDANSAGRVVAALLALSQKKAFLKETVAAVLLDLLLGGPPQKGAAANGVAGGKGKKGQQQAESTTWLEPAALATLLGKGAGSCDPLRTYLSVPAPDASPEALLLALCLWPQMPEELAAQAPVPQGVAPPPASFVLRPESVAWSKVEPAASAVMSQAYLAAILPALKASTSSSPRMHTLWSYLLPYLLPGFRPNKGEQGAEGGSAAVVAADPAALETFWTTVCEGALLSSSHERRHLALQLFQVLLPRVPAASVAAVFSKNLCRTLADNLRDPTATLYAMSRRVMERVSGYLEKSQGGDEGSRLAVASALQRMGGLGYDALAKGKATSKLVSGMDAEGVRTYCQQHMAAFLAGTSSMTAPSGAGSKRKRSDAEEAGSDDEDRSEDEDEEGDAASATNKVERARAGEVEALCSVMRLPAASDEDRMGVLRFLATHAFFTPAPDAAPAGATSAKKTPSKKKAQQAAALPAELEAAAKAAAEGSAAITEATRRLCAARLVGLASHVPGGLGAKAQEGGEQQAQQGGRKKAKGPEGSAVATPHADPSRLLGPVVEFVRATARVPGATPAAALGDEADVALSMLQEIEDGVAPLASAPGTTGSTARARAMLQLAQLLQLHVLGDPAAAPDAGLLMDLRRLAVEAVGAKLTEVESQAVKEEEDGSEEAGEGEEGEGAPPPWPVLVVDVLLSLLSRPAAPLPSAPLRSACEALWRATCDGLTEEGMQDLLRVVASGIGAGAGVGEDDDDDVFEGMEDDEEEVLIGGSSDDEDEDDDDDDEEAEEAKAAAGSKRKAGEEESEDAEDEEGAKKVSARKPKAVEEEESESEEESEGMDDEAMFRMDTHIGAHLKLVMEQRRNVREAKAALAALRFRALALLEAFAKKAPTSPLLLSCLVPLLRNLSVASRPGGDSAMAARVRVVLTAITKAKPAYDANLLPISAPAVEEEAPKGKKRAPAPAPATDLVGVLRKLVAIAARAPEKSVAEAGAGALGTLLRAAAASQEAGAATAAANALVSALSDFFRSKRTRLTRNGLQSCLSRAPGAALAPEPYNLLLKEAGGAARNSFKQVEALDLLSSLLRGAASAPEGVAALPPSAAASFKSNAGALGAALVSAACGAGMKPEHHVGAIKSAVAAVEAVRRLFPERKLPELVGAENLNALAKAIVTIRELGVPDRVGAQLSRIAQATAITPLLATAAPDPALKTKLTKAKAKAAEAKTQQQQPGGKKEAGKKGKGAQSPGKQAGGKQGKQGQKSPGKGKKAEGGKPSPSKKAAASASPGKDGGKPTKKPRAK